MIKKILVVLDTAKSSQRVRDMAINIALNTQAKLTGVGILDTQTITTPHIEPLAGVAYNIDHEKEIIEKSHLHILELIKIFTARAKENNIQIDTAEINGDPREQINLLSNEHNMVIISRKTNFHYEGEDESDITVKKVAKDNPRPMIMVPPFEKLGEDILIAYDGSLEATRSLHMFLLLGLWQGRNIHILNVNKDVEEGHEIAMQACRMCELYEIKPFVHCKQSSEQNVPKIIMKLAEDIKAWMVVIGSFRHNYLHDTLFGSCTSKLMRKSIVPLFIYH